MDREELLKLYASSVEEELRWTASHQERVTFYSGLLNAIVAGIGFGLFQASQWQHFGALAVGTAILYIVADNAKGGTFREYQRLLEAIVFRAKIEQELGLTKERTSDTEASNRYWANEPFIPSRHIQSRIESGSSQEFVQKYSDKGYQGLTNSLFDKFRILSAVMFLVFLGVSVWLAY
jgi:hypothetical protein